MNRLVIIAAASLIATTAAVPAAAADGFDGTWKTDLKSTQFSKKPSVQIIKDGEYTCSTCIPAVKVKADGGFHKVVGQPYYDEMAVTVVDAKTIKRETKKAGKSMGGDTYTIAADGKSRSYTFTDLTAANGVPVTGTGKDTRVAAGPAGAHAVSGSWISATVADIADAGLTYTMAVKGDVVTYSTPTGVSYAAKLGGPQAKVTGDPGWTAVTVKRTGDNAILETDFYKGKAITTVAMKISADGKTMLTDFVDLRRDRKSSYVAIKQ